MSQLGSSQFGLIRLGPDSIASVETVVTTPDGWGYEGYGSGPWGGTDVEVSGSAFVAEYLVSGLVANSDCRGLGVYLQWSNPVGAQNVQIVRRLKAWPFDLTDAGYDVLYNGPPITSFLDTGITQTVQLTTAATVPGQNFVLVPSTSGYSPGDQVRVEALSGPQSFDLMTVSVVTSGQLTFSAAMTNGYATGARVAHSSPLQPQTYYYYLVLVSNLITPGNVYDIDDASRAMALSMDVYNSAEWFKLNTPTVNLARDANPPGAQGGSGGGFLAKWFQVMGCWLNLMRGFANAVQLLNDPDKAPFNALTALNEQLGIVPEGFSYDFDIVRRPLTSLAFVYKQKGSCPAIVEVVSMFTKWNSVCVGFGDSSCNDGPTDLTLWDGISSLYLGGPVLGVTQQVISADGTAVFTDSTATWAAHQWLNGKLQGLIGDVACVQDNPTTGSSVTISPPRPLTMVTSALSATNTMIDVASTVELEPNMTVQLTDTVPTGGAYNAEIVEILAITPGVPGSFTIKGAGLKNSYNVGAMCTIAKSIIRTEYLGYSGTTSAGFVLSDPQASFIDHQWSAPQGPFQFVLLDSANVLHAIVDNVEVGGVCTITVDNTHGDPAPGAYSIVRSMVVGGSFAARQPELNYTLEVGVHTTINEPTLNLPEKGTIYDPFNRLWAGPGLNLSGTWGPADVGVYILGDVPVIVGVASTITSGSVLTLDPSQPPPAAGALVGMWLNPNQNQKQLFKILSNTTTTVTVGTDVSSLLVPGQWYYVLTPRDRNRFQRLTARLETEFSDTDAKIHVLFI